MPVTSVNSFSMWRMIREKPTWKPGAPEGPCSPFSPVAPYRRNTKIIYLLDFFFWFQGLYSFKVFLVFGIKII